MNLSVVMFSASCLFYFLSFVTHMLSLFGVEKAKNRFAFSLMRVGFLFATFSFVSEAIGTGSFLPVLNFSQAMAFFAWSLAFVYLVFLIRIQTVSFGVVLSPILFILTFVGLLTIQVQTAEVPTWSKEIDPYFKLHIMSAFFAYASFTLSFAAGILYLVRNRELKQKSPSPFYHRLPSVVELEELIVRPLFWGVPLLILTIGVGFLWSKSAFGEFWIYDPKTIVTIVTAALYLFIMMMRVASKLHGKQVAVLSLCAFALMIVSFVGSRFIEDSHNYLQ